MSCSSLNESTTAGGASAVTPGSLFSIGDLVVVGEQELRAYIVDMYEEEEEDEGESNDQQQQREGAESNTSTISKNMLFSVVYEIGNELETDVELSRLRVISFNDRGHNRSGLNRNSAAPRNSTNQSTPTSSSSNATNRQASTEIQALKKAFQSSFTYMANANKSNSNQPHPLIKLLEDNKHREKGWLRIVIKQMDEVDGDGNNNSQEQVRLKKELDERESHVLILASAIFSGYSPFHGKAKGYSKLLNHAFGISKNCRVDHLKRFVDRDFSAARKVRSDVGTSVFNSDKKRAHTYTAYNVFKRRRSQEFRETNDKIPQRVLRQEYEQLAEEQKIAYSVIAERELERAKTLWDELTDFLLRTKGKISYKAMAQHLGDNIVNDTTIRKYLQKQESFSVRKDRILPSLDRQSRIKRVRWAIVFWIFWKSVAACPVQKVVFVVVHMDEKWFYAIRTRTNCKVLTSIGLEAQDYYAHHKNHVGKVMYIVATAYVLHDNNIGHGGTAVPLACVRVGKMVKAQKDTYKRVYAEDGTFTYPKIAENQLRHEGREYFEGFELTGSSEGTEKKPKISLLKIYKEEIIPALEEKVVRRFNENGNRQVVIVKQEDNAGLHTDGTYLAEMRNEFERRDWILFNQPSQSPVTNVHDACIFPMLSKAVSRQQAVVFGSRMLQTEQLHEAVMTCWNDKSNVHAMAKAFAAHHQIVCAILEHNGDNTYLSEKGGLSFGIRRMFVCDEEGDGVVPVTLAPENIHQTAAAKILEDKRRQGLKYQAPDLRTFDDEGACLTNEMKDILMAYMEEDLMDDDVREIWTRIMLEHSG